MEQSLSTTAPWLVAGLDIFAAVETGQPGPGREEIHSREAWPGAVWSRLRRLAAWSGYVLLSAGTACADEYGSLALSPPVLGQDEPRQ